MSPWTAQADATIPKTTLTFAESENLSTYVKITGNRKAILKSVARRGADGRVLRFSNDLGVTSVSSVEPSTKFRFRMYWLRHSASGVLGILALLSLTVGTILIGLSTIQGWHNPNGFQVGAQTWLGFALNVLAVVLSGIRELFTDPVVSSQ